MDQNSPKHCLIGLMASLSKPWSNRCSRKQVMFTTFVTCCKCEKCDLPLGIWSM